jgi:hypothetical protein
MIPSHFSKDWQPKAARLVRLGWKLRQRWFPKVGKSRADFSQPWKMIAELRGSVIM